MSMEYVAAIDIGGTKIAATVASIEGMVARLTLPTPKSGPIRTLPEQAVALLDAACRQAGISSEKVDTVGVSSAGPFVLANGMLGIAAPNICGAGGRSKDLPNDWDIVPLEQVLRERFDHVHIENDCVAALIAERTFGSLQGEEHCVYVTWSTGIGFGLCVDGHILGGKNRNAGHAGHMLISEREDALCGCGNRGDVEGLISGRNLANRLGMTTAEIFDAARRGDAQAVKVASDAARWFGRTLYNLIATLDVRAFAVGGSVWQHHGEWMLPMIMREIESRLPALTRGVSVHSAGLGAFVTDMGALSLVIPDEWTNAWRGAQPWLG